MQIVENVSGIQCMYWSLAKMKDQIASFTKAVIKDQIINKKRNSYLINETPKKNR